MIGGEPFHLVGIARPHIDLLVAEHQRGARRPARARIEYLDLHSQHLAIPLRGAGDVGDIDDAVIEGVYLNGYGLSFRRRAMRAGVPHWPGPDLFVTTRAAVDST